MFKFSNAVALILLSASLTGCGFQARSPKDSSLNEAWNVPNAPITMAGDYEVVFATLPLAAELETKPWTDTYWPSYQGGLANRWNDPQYPDAFSYNLNQPLKLKLMGLEKRKHLSPAEKFDAFIGNFDYPLVMSERQRTSPDNPTWYGLCHGWAPASVNFEEPKPVVIKGARGIAMPFGSSDIKALLTMAQQYQRDRASTNFLGERCNRDLNEEPEYANDPECRDTNAGSFHIVLTNQIALKSEAFIVDINRDIQVWNQPVFGYSSTLVGESTEVYETAAEGTVKIVTIETNLRYVVERGPMWDAYPISEHPEQAYEKFLSYTLELNEAGEIIGGEWITEARPDFLWKQTAPEFTGYFEALETIYKASIAE